MPWLGSIFYALKAVRCNPLAVVHGMAYAATVTYLRVLRSLVRLNAGPVRSHISETYHGKVLRLEDARRIVTINRDLELRKLDQVLPYRHATDLILKNPQNIVVYECPCRAQKPDPCRPTDVCLVIGDPFVDLLRMFQPFRSRRISPEEALAILREEDARGHVHTAWFKQAMLDRFYAICNCCKCCCLGMKFTLERRMNMLLPSGYRAVVGNECVGCRQCLPSCQFAAIEPPAGGAGSGRCRIDRERCFGCGICESKCRKGAISLILDPAKGVPLNIEALERGAATPAAAATS